MTDYHEFTTRDMPQDERRRLNVGDVWINAATCERCGDYVRSGNRHDFVSCGCGALSVDGGSWYCRRLFSEDVAFTNHIEMFDDVSKEEPC